MVQITFLQAGNAHVLKAESGISILEAARQAGVSIEAPCSGNGTCGKCKVKIIKENKEQDIVLACHTQLENDLTVEIPKQQDSKNVQIIQHGHRLHIPLDGLIKKRYDAVSNRTEVVAGHKVLGKEPGNTLNAHYGLVVDIGTTTLVTALFDLNTGRELASTAALNPQSRHAQDVLSRIKFAATPDGLSVMHNELIQILNNMIITVTTQAYVQPQHIYEIVFSGNTCMLHLAMNIDPASLGKFPYTPAITGGNHYNAADYGILAAHCAQIYLPPVMSAYVGADITSGILAAQLTELAGITLFIDIGTNGEMVLAADGRLIATSTAAGPAFEGMNIACGMRAAPGAIEKFTLDQDGIIEIKTIDDQTAEGICGSGLLDIVGELVKHGLVSANGKLTPQFTGQEGKPVFPITEDVYLSQKDIRQVQLAKGAIRAGIEALLATTGVQSEAVDRVYIAGSFGYHLNPSSLIQIGLLPQAFQDKIEFLGNTSKTGGQAFLLNNPSRRKMAEAVAEIQVLELATTPNFDKLFVSCLNF